MSTNNADQPAYARAASTVKRWDEGDEYRVTFEPEDGLTKRELIAAMAMQGLLAAPGTSGSHDEFAEEACKYADALLAELAKPVAANGVTP